MNSNNKYYSSVNFKQRILEEKNPSSNQDIVSPPMEVLSNAFIKINNQWTTNDPNPNGIKPPHNKLEPLTNYQLNYNHPIPSQESIMLKEPAAFSKIQYPLYQINAREPYRVQYMINGYGGHQSSCGTDIGR